MSGEWFDLWLPAFFVTLLTETPIYALFLRDRIGLGAALLLGLALQCVTHPLFWLAWHADEAFFNAHYGLAVLSFETVIYLVEAWIVWMVLAPRQPWHRLANLELALIASTAANTMSLLVGILSER